MWDNVDPVAAAALTSHHGVTGRLLASIDGGPFTTRVPLRRGTLTVSVDGTAFVRRSMDAVIEVPLGDPITSVTRTEMRAEYGVTVAGVTYWCPLGTFVVTTAREARPGLTKITGKDRAQRIVDGRLEGPIDSYDSTVIAIRNLVTGADSRIGWTDHTGSAATHPLTRWDRDRDAAVKKLVATLGAVLVFDPWGDAHLYRVPAAPGRFDPSSWTVRRGPGGGFIAGERGADRAGIYNSVVVTGEPADGGPAVQAVARDLDPQSDTRWGGAFGVKPRFYSSPLLTTVAQAQAAADGMLPRVLGQALDMDVEALPHPGLEPTLDTVTVETSPSTLRTVMLDGMTIPCYPATGKLQIRSTETLESEQ